MSVFSASGPGVVQGGFLPARLRLETEHEHRLLENQLDLLRPGLTAAEYCRLLERFFGFYAPWEQQIDPLIERWLPEFSVERRKTPKLAADLQYFGVAMDRIELREARAMYPNAASLLGALYVSEGSTLGGQIVAKRVKEILNLEAASGYSFFSSYGREVGQKWREFQELLIRRTTVEMEPVVVESALQTFQDLRRWFGNR